MRTPFSSSSFILPDSFGEPFDYFTVMPEIKRLLVNWLFGSFGWLFWLRFESGFDFASKVKHG